MSGIFSQRQEKPNEMPRRMLWLVAAVLLLVAPKTAGESEFPVLPPEMRFAMDGGSSLLVPQVTIPELRAQSGPVLSVARRLRSCGAGAEGCRVSDWDVRGIEPGPVPNANFRLEPGRKVRRRAHSSQTIGAAGEKAAGRAPDQLAFPFIPDEAENYQ